jgi:hypothetical protein
VSAAVGEVELDARELIRHALAQDEELRAVLTEAIGAIDDDGATRRLGRLLARAEGVHLGEHRIERTDDGSGDCATWRIVRV